MFKKVMRYLDDSDKYLHQHIKFTINTLNPFGRLHLVLNYSLA